MAPLRLDRLRPMVWVPSVSGPSSVAWVWATLRGALLGVFVHCVSLLFI